MRQVVLEARDIQVSFGDRTVLGPLNLEINAGERVAVLGANGAGKSTLLKALFGEIRLRNGSIAIKGESVLYGGASRLARSGCFLAPFGMDVYPDLTVEDNLLLFTETPSTAQQNSQANVLNSIKHILELFPRLAEHRNTPAGRLSGGERRMLALSRAQLQRPWLLLWDEPFSGLAPALIPEAQRSLTVTRKDSTILVAEQNLNPLMEFCTHALVLLRGRSVFYGAIEELPNSSEELFVLLHGRVPVS